MLQQTRFYTRVPRTGANIQEATGGDGRKVAACLRGGGVPTHVVDWLEAGDGAGTEEGMAANEGYCDIVRYGNVRFAMLQHLRKPPKDFEDALRLHFSLRKADLLALCEVSCAP